MAENKPLASYENSRYSGKHHFRDTQGKRGHSLVAGNAASTPVTFAGSDNNVTFAATDPLVGARIALTDMVARSYTARAVKGGSCASGEMNPAGANNKVRIIAKNPGIGGNSITVTYVDPAGNNQALSVSVLGNAITVNLATDGAGAITSTAAAVVTAIGNSAPASALIEAVGTEAVMTGLVTALAAMTLVGGTTDPILTEVLLGLNASLAITTTAAQLKTLLDAVNSPLVTATLAEGDGSGVVTALAITDINVQTPDSVVSGSISVLAEDKESTTALLAGSTSHNKQTEEGMQPLRLQDILTDRVDEDKDIIDAKKNQEIQHVGPTTTTAL